MPSGRLSGPKNRCSILSLARGAKREGVVAHLCLTIMNSKIALVVALGEVGKVMRAERPSISLQEVHRQSRLPSEETEV